MQLKVQIKENLKCSGILSLISQGYHLRCQWFSAGAGRGNTIFGSSSSSPPKKKSSSHPHDLNQGADRLHDNHGVPAGLRHHSHCESCGRGWSQDTQWAGVSEVFLELSTEWATIFTKNIATILILVIDDEPEGEPQYMPINQFQVGFAIASGDQSRLFLLKVFFSQIMIRWWWCIIVHICDGDDGYDDPGRWERQCKTGSSGKSEGQVANVQCSSFIIRITIITTIIIIARNVHWHHCHMIGTRYGNYSLEIRATDKGLEPNSASAIYNVNIQPSSSHLTFLQCFHQICNHCSLATFSIAGVCHWLQWPPSQVCESAQEFHNPCGRGWRGELVGDFEDTLTGRKRIPFWSATSQVGAPVIKVRAVDTDIGNNGAVRLSLLPLSPSSTPVSPFIP